MNEPITAIPLAPIPPGNDYTVLKGLEPGQSVLFTGYNEAALRASLMYYQRRYRVKLTLRKRPEGIRVWRTA